MNQSIEELQATYLSRLLEKFTRKITDPSSKHFEVLIEKFRWSKTRRKYKMKLKKNPVPPPLDQQEHELCIPYATKTILQFQMNLIALLSKVKVVVPNLSLAHMIDMYYSLEHRYTKDFLKLVSEIGIVAEDDYIENKGPREGATRYFLDWSYGFVCQRIAGEVPPPAEDLDWLIKFCIVRYGGVLGELYMTDKYDYKGRFIFDGTGMRPPTDTTPLGHLVTILGWERKVFSYLNTFGIKFGKKGYGALLASALHHVYVPQIRIWFDPKVGM